jgi:hypothetical protein
MKTAKKIVGLMMLAMLLILAQIMPAMAEEGSTEGETKSVRIAYDYTDKNGNSKTEYETVEVSTEMTGKEFCEKYKNKTFDDAPDITGWFSYESEAESPVNSYVWFYATGQATYAITIEYVYMDTNGVTVNKYVNYTAKGGATWSEFIKEHETDIHEMDKLAATTEWDFSYWSDDFTIDRSSYFATIYAVYSNEYRINYGYEVRGVYDDYFRTGVMWLPDECEEGSAKACDLVEEQLRATMSSYKDYALESCVWNNEQSRYEIILCPDPTKTFSLNIECTYKDLQGLTKEVTVTYEIPQGTTIGQFKEKYGYPTFDDAAEMSGWKNLSYYWNNSDYDGKVITNDDLKIYLSGIYEDAHYDGYTVYIMENEGDEENLGWSEEGLLFYEGGNHPAVFIAPNDYEIGSDEIYDLVEANFKAKYPEYANYTCYKEEYVEWNAVMAKTHYRMYFVLEKDDEATPTPTTTPAVKPVTKGFSIENITYSNYKDGGVGTYLSAYNENPSATTLTTNLKAINAGVDTSILSGNVSVSEFFEVNNDNGSDKAATVALNFKNIVDSSKGKVSAVYAYHYCKTHTRVELVTGTDLNTKDGTASFSFDALSPVALVVVYSKTESTTPATEPATTPSTTPATTSATTTETTAVSATSPNTGANDITTLLMAVAVVSLGAAVVIGKKKFS